MTAQRHVVTTVAVMESCAQICSPTIKVLRPAMMEIRMTTMLAHLCVKHIAAAMELYAKIYKRVKKALKPVMTVIRTTQIGVQTVVNWRFVGTAS